MSFDLEKYVTELPPSVKEYVQRNITDWINQTVIASIHKKANEVGVSQRYHDAIKLVQLGEWRFQIELDYFGPKGEPLGIWFELGTKAHIIEAKFANFLHWVTNKLIPANFPQFTKLGGKWLQNHFARFVKHPGTKAHHIMQDGAKEGFELLARKIILETNTRIALSGSTL